MDLCLDLGRAGFKEQRGNCFWWVGQTQPYRRNCTTLEEWREAMGRSEGKQPGGGSI